jgi:hypothetical protein
MIGVGVGTGVAEGVAVGTGVEDGVSVTAIRVGGKVGDKSTDGSPSGLCVGVTNNAADVGVGDTAAGAKSVHHTHSTSNNKIHATTNTPMIIITFRCIVPLLTAIKSV